MQQFYTYLHCKPNGEPFYVGKGHDTPKGRRSHDLSNRSEFHKRTVAKYGRDNIGIFVFPCDSELQAFDDEIQQIAQLKRAGFGLCNFTEGGTGATGSKSEAHKAKISAANKGKTCWKKGLKDSPETIAKRSLSLMGNKNCLGKKNALGWKPNDEQLAKLVSSSKNKLPMTQETKDKIAASNLGNKNSFGRKDSAETIAKRKASLKATNDSGRGAKGKPWSPARRAAYLNKDSINKGD